MLQVATTLHCLPRTRLVEAARASSQHARERDAGSTARTLPVRGQALETLAVLMSGARGRPRLARYGSVTDVADPIVTIGHVGIAEPRTAQESASRG